MRSVRVGKVDLVYDDVGRGERPLVLVHGYTGSRRDFRPVLSALAESTRVIALDQRGHGDSTHLFRDSLYSLDLLAKDLTAVLEAVGAPPADLLGHSMGGMIAARAALARPDLVSSLILMNTSGQAHQMPLPQPASTFRQGIRAMKAMFTADTVETLLATLEGGPEVVDRFRPILHRNLISTDRAAYRSLRRDIGVGRDLLPELDRLACPTSIIVGERDATFLGASQTLARVIPGAQLVVLPAAGHQPQFETPGPWLRAVRAHLDRARAPA